jgi:hypothetical protein
MHSGAGDYPGHTGGISLILYSSSHPSYASARILNELGLGGDHGNGLCGTRANERAGKHRILYRQVKNLAIFLFISTNHNSAPQPARLGALR